MKKSLLVLVSLLMLVACDKENEFHQTYFQYPSGFGAIFADQTLDSVVFYTTENYRLKSDAAWCRVPEGRSTFNDRIPNGIILFSIPLTFDVNTTGESRSTTVSLTVNDDVLSVYFVQMPWLNIQRPVRTIENDLSRSTLADLVVASDAVRDSLIFTAYGDWTLTTHRTPPLLPTDWLTLTESQGKAGSHTVYFDLSPNPSGADRTAEITLTSAAVSDVIKVRQEGQAQ